MGFLEVDAGEGVGLSIRTYFEDWVSRKLKPIDWRMFGARRTRLWSTISTMTASLPTNSPWLKRTTRPSSTKRHVEVSMLASPPILRSCVCSLGALVEGRSGLRDSYNWRVLWMSRSSARVVVGQLVA